MQRSLLARNGRPSFVCPARVTFHVPSSSSAAAAATLSSARDCANRAAKSTEPASRTRGRNCKFARVVQRRTDGQRERGRIDNFRIINHSSLSLLSHSLFPSGPLLPFFRRLEKTCSTRQMSIPRTCVPNRNMKKFWCPVLKRRLLSNMDELLPCRGNHVCASSI